MRVRIANWKPPASAYCDIPRPGCWVIFDSQRMQITRIKELEHFIYLAWAGTFPFLITCYDTLPRKEKKSLIGNSFEAPERGNIMELYCLDPSGEWKTILTSEVKGFIVINDGLYKVDTESGNRYYVVVN